jgi:hypothetical protein
MNVSVCSCVVLLIRPPESTNLFIIALWVKSWFFSIFIFSSTQKTWIFIFIFPGLVSDNCHHWKFYASRQLQTASSRDRCTCVDPWTMGNGAQVYRRLIFLDVFMINLFFQIQRTFPWSLIWQTLNSTYRIWQDH